MFKTIEEKIEEERRNYNKKHSEPKCPFCGYENDINVIEDEMLEFIDFDITGGGIQKDKTVICSKCGKKYDLCVDININVVINTWVEQIDDEIIKDNQNDSKNQVLLF